VSASVLFGKTTEASFLSLSAPSEQCLATPPADCMHPIRRPGSCASHGIHSLVCLPPALDISATRPLPVTVASNLRQSDTNPTTRSAIVVSHHLDGLLRIAAPGVLQPKPNEVRCVSVTCIPVANHLDARPLSKPALSRNAFHTPRRIPLANSRTASLRPLPSCRFVTRCTARASGTRSRLTQPWLNDVRARGHRTLARSDAETSHPSPSGRWPYEPDESAPLTGSGCHRNSLDISLTEVNETSRRITEANASHNRKIPRDHRLQGHYRKSVVVVSPP